MTASRGYSIQGSLLPTTDLIELLLSNDHSLGTDPASYGFESAHSLHAAVVAAWKYLKSIVPVSESPQGSAETEMANQEAWSQWLQELMRTLGYPNSTLARSPSAACSPSNYEFASSSETPTKIHPQANDWLWSSSAVGCDHQWALVQVDSALRLVRLNARLPYPFLEFDLDLLMHGETESEFELLFRTLHASRLSISLDKAPTEQWLERWWNHVRVSRKKQTNRLTARVQVAWEALINAVRPQSLCFPQQPSDHPASLDDETCVELARRVMYQLLIVRYLIDHLALDPLPLPFISTARAFRVSLADDHALAPEGTELWRQWEALVCEIAEGLERDLSSNELAQGCLLQSQLRGSADEQRSIAQRFGETSFFAPRDLASALVLPNRDWLNIANLVLNDDAKRSKCRLDGALLGEIHEQLLGWTVIQEPVDSKLRVVSRIEQAAGGDSHRKRSGTYFTSEVLVHAILDHTLDPVTHELRQRLAMQSSEDDIRDVCGSIRIADVAVGTGRFLLPAAQRLARTLAKRAPQNDHPTKSYESVYRQTFAEVVRESLLGVDVNPIAAQLAGWILWSEAPEHLALSDILSRSISVGNSLLEFESIFKRRYRTASHERPSCDVVVGNPPWISFLGRQQVAIAAEELQEVKRRFPEVSRWPATHSVMLLLSIQSTKPGGRIGLVLPRQVAEIDAYAPVRAAVNRMALLSQSVIDVGEDAFEGVIQPTGLFCFQRREQEFETPKEGPWEVAGQTGAMGGRSLRVSIDVKSVNWQTRCNAVLSRAAQFEAGTFFDLGVHTGNVAKKVVRKSMSNGGQADWEPIRMGRDIDRYYCGAPGHELWIRPQLEGNEYCTIRSRDRYVGTPILIRQTANRPIACLHQPAHYYRNSLLGCRGFQGVSDRVLIALLNSSLLGWWHRTTVLEANQSAFPQVKIKHLQQLPVPVWEELSEPTAYFDGSILDHLEHWVRQAENAVAARVPLSPAIDLQIERGVLAAFGLEVQWAELLLEQVG